MGRRGWALLVGMLICCVRAPYAAPGRYLGAFIQEDSEYRGNIAAFERALGGPLSFYATYRAYGKPFPVAWARKVIASQRGLLIFWEPWESEWPLERITEDSYLRRWAGTLSRCPVPVLLVFGSEPNIDQDGLPIPYGEFRDKFRLVSAAMRRMAPRVEMVFSLARPGVTRAPRCSELYYPGDDYVDWVCFTSYDNGDARAWDELASVLRWASALWPTKALGLTEVGCDRLFPGAGNRLLSFFQRSLDTVPQVRFINYFSMDAGDRARNPKPVYYRLAPGSEPMAALQWAVASGKFHLGQPPLTIAAQRLTTEADPYVLRGEALVGLYAALPAALTGRAAHEPPQLAEALAWLRAHKIVQGFPDGDDRPEEAILGSDIALLLWRLFSSFGGQLTIPGGSIPIPFRTEPQITGPNTLKAAQALCARGAFRQSADAELLLTDCVRQHVWDEVLRWVQRLTVRMEGPKPGN